MLNLRLGVLTGMILAAALSRVLPHPWNFTPIGAMALFGGARFTSYRSAFLVPLAAMFVSDLILGFHRGIWVVYGTFVAITCIGLLLRARRKVWHTAAATLAGSVIFFATTNFAVWAAGRLYPLTWEGLVACYIAAVPFFQNTMAGDAFYVTLLFGAFAMAERRFPVLRESPGARFAG